MAGRAVTAPGGAADSRGDTSAQRQGQKVAQGRAVGSNGLVLPRTWLPSITWSVSKVLSCCIEVKTQPEM